MLHETTSHETTNGDGLLEEMEEEFTIDSNDSDDEEDLMITIDS